MATSGVITSSLTVRDIIKAAMDEVGALVPGEDPSADEAQTGLTRLNWMLKSWQIERRQIWRWEDISIDWTADQASAEMTPACLDLTDLQVVVGGQDRPLQHISMAEYQELPNKTQTGTPTLYSTQKTRGSILLRIWPVPNVATTLKGNVVRIIQDVTSLDETLDVPQEWTEAVWVNLADRLPPSLKSAMNQLERQELTARAAFLVERLAALDDEHASVFFQPGRY